MLLLDYSGLNKCKVHLDNSPVLVATGLLIKRLWVQLWYLGNATMKLLVLVCFIKTDLVWKLAIGLNWFLRVIRVQLAWFCAQFSSQFCGNRFAILVPGFSSFYNPNLLARNFQNTLPSKVVIIWFLHRQVLPFNLGYEHLLKRWKNILNKF